MKAVGLITEYNPLHTGHIYHMNKAKEITGADCCIAVMSGNFVQRGEPAVVNKYLRCAAAIEAGVNLCIELPSYYAVSSAENFADGAVKLLNSLMCNYVVFGSECGDIDILYNAADILINEPESYRTELKSLLSNGLSFPAARQNALVNYITTFTSNSSKKTTTHLHDKSQQEIVSALSSPNNILGIEYIKSIIKHDFKLKPFTITRQGTGYNENVVNGLPSASAIRTILYDYIDKTPDKYNQLPKELEQLLPESMVNKILEQPPIKLDHLTPLFNYKMSELFNKCFYDKNAIAKELSSYTDISIELGNRMADCFKGNEPLSVYCMNVKSRQYTYSRICRCVLHVILNITKIKSARYDGDNVPYIRILGFDKVGQKYLSEIKKKCSTPIITKTADYKDLLVDDIYCSSIYNQLVYNTYNSVIKDEFRQHIYRKV